MMLKKLILIVIVCFVTFGFQLGSCQTEDDRINVMSPDVKGNIVFFFKKGTTSDEILEFHRTVTGTPTSSSSGFSDLPGIMTSVRVIVNGFEGESINFQPSATEEEKAFVKKRVSESPLIYKVYENVVPNEINDLPGEKKAEPNKTPDTRPAKEPKNSNGQ